MTCGYKVPTTPSEQDLIDARTIMQDMIGVRAVADVVRAAKLRAAIAAERGGVK